MTDPYQEVLVSDEDVLHPLWAASKAPYPTGQAYYVALFYEIRWASTPFDGSPHERREVLNFLRNLWDDAVLHHEALNSDFYYLLGLIQYQAAKSIQRLDIRCGPHGRAIFKRDREIIKRLASGITDAVTQEIL